MPIIKIWNWLDYPFQDSENAGYGWLKFTSLSNPRPFLTLTTRIYKTLREPICQNTSEIELKPTMDRKTNTHKQTQQHRHKDKTRICQTRKSAEFQTLKRDAYSKKINIFEASNLKVWFWFDRRPIWRRFEGISFSLAHFSLLCSCLCHAYN